MLRLDCVTPCIRCEVGTRWRRSIPKCCNIAGPLAHVWAPVSATAVTCPGLDERGSEQWKLLCALGSGVICTRRVGRGLGRCSVKRSLAWSHSMFGIRILWWRLEPRGCGLSELDHADELAVWRLVVNCFSSSVIVANHEDVVSVIAVPCVWRDVAIWLDNVVLPVLPVVVGALLRVCDVLFSLFLRHTLARCPIMWQNSHETDHAGQCFLRGLLVPGPCSVLPQPSQPVGDMMVCEAFCCRDCRCADRWTVTDDWTVSWFLALLPLSIACINSNFSSNDRTSAERARSSPCMSWS